jgi:hypothetical protein
MKLATDNRDLGFDPREFNLSPVDKAYQDALGDGLEHVLGAGAETIEDLVKGLNELSVTGPNGEAWTTESLAAELNRLGQ